MIKQTIFILTVIVTLLVGNALGRPLEKAAGFGSDSVVGNQATGTGTGIAKPGPGGFGTSLGVGGATALPIGNVGFGQGESISVGK